MRRIITALATAGLAAGLLAAPQLAPKAEANVAYNAKVGTITGWYVPACGTDCGRDYRGEFWPQLRPQCIVVQRKSGGGLWTSNYVNGGANCTAAARAPWSITNDAKVSDTVGIRIWVTSGWNAGSYVNLCSSKDACLAMRGGG